LVRENPRPEDSDFLPAAGVAAELNITPQTVRMLIRRGELAGLKVGHVFRVHRADLAAFIEAGRAKVVAS
jgi:excisionase family DNA binding protein